MLIAPPPHFKPVIAIVPHYFGDQEEGRRVFQSLADIKPYVSSEMTPLVPNLSDHLDFACGKGGFRRSTVTGLVITQHQLRYNLEQIKLEVCRWMATLYDMPPLPYRYCMLRDKTARASNNFAGDSKH